MPDLINPLLSDAASTPDVQLPTYLDTTWERPKIEKPDFLRQAEQVMPQGDMSLTDFTKAINDRLTPEQVKAKQADDKLISSLIPSGPVAKPEMSFRYFGSNEAMRYKSNDKLWQAQGFNPLVSQDITDAIYDHNESTWDSFKNILPKAWSTTAFAYKNYFDEYIDAAKALGTLDSKMLFNGKRFEEYAKEQKDLEDLNPDYKTDKQVKWWQLNRGDYWEESASSLGFTIGTIGAAATENLAISLATAGFGEIPELYNSPRKVFNAISDYYSLKKAYGLVKGVTKAKSVLDFMGTVGNIYRLVNGGLSEAAFEGATNKSEYIDSFKDRFLKSHGYAASATDLELANKAGDEMAKKTILFETPFLLASNAVQFGNMIAPKTIEKILTAMGKEGAYRVVLDATGKAVVEATAPELKGFAKFASKAGHIVKNSMWEGTEESYQALVTKSTADYYNDKYFDKDNHSITKSLGVGFDYITSNDGLKEFSAGFATGALFDAVAQPFHWAGKPKATYNAKTEQNDYDLKWYNKFFNIGMEKVNDEIEKKKFQGVADNLNSIDIGKVLKEDGLLSYIKDRETSLALGKFTKDNDIFNMHNAQLLQLNRFLFAGLTNGKIDLQISKLSQFAGQDFKTLSDYFGLDENDYPTDADKTKLQGSIKSFVGDLQGRSKEFEKIYEREKKSYQGILGIIHTRYKTALSSEEGLKDQLRKKYATTSNDELESKISEEEHMQLSWVKNFREQHEMTFYAANEAMKASVFSQAGMMDDAKRGKDLVRKIIGNDSTNAHYDELSHWFVKGNLDRTLKQLEEDEKLAEDIKSEDLPLKRELVKRFRMIHEDLNGAHDDGKKYNESDVASNLQDYLHLVSKRNGGKDFNKGEEIEQWKMLTEYIKLQRQHQENLNLYNYLSAIHNRAGYIQTQSNKLREFFAKANELGKQDAKESDVVVEPVDAAKPAAPAAPATPPPPAGPTAPGTSAKPGQAPVVAATFITELDSLLKQEIAQDIPNMAVIVSHINKYPQFKAEVLKYLLSSFTELTKEMNEAIDTQTVSEEQEADFEDIISKLFEMTEDFEDQGLSKDILDPLNDFADAISTKWDNYQKPDNAVSDLEMISNPEKYIGSTVSMRINGEDKTFIIKAVGTDGVMVAETSDPNTDLLIATDAWSRAIQETKDHIDPLKDEKGRKQVKHNLQLLKDETDPLKQSNIIYNLEKNTNINPNSISAEELASVKEIKDQLAKDGYETVDLQNKEYDEGMRLTVNSAVESNDPEEGGKTVIFRVNKPQINKDGVMVQAAEVSTIVNVGEKEFELLTSKKPVYNYPVEVRKMIQDHNLSNTEMDEITAGRKKNLVTEDDVKKYLKNRDEEKVKREAETRKRVIAALSSDPIQPITGDDLTYYNLNKDEIDKEVKKAPISQPKIIPAQEDETDNELDIAVDDAKTHGIFYFVQNLPNEIAKFWEKGKAIILRSAEGDQKEQALRLHNTMKTMSSLNNDRNFFSEEDVDENGETKKVRSFKVQLIRGNEKEHSDWVFWNMKGQPNYRFPFIIAVIVDKEGNNVYFDTKGNIVGENEGKPVAFAYSHQEYLKDNLNKSRKNVMTDGKADLTEFDEAGYERLDNRETDPLADITRLIDQEPVYGSIEGVTNGTLSRSSSVNSPNRSKKGEEVFRTLQQIIDDDDLDENAEPMIAISHGDYLEDNEGKQTVKRGQVYVYDKKSGLYISLRGNKIKDLTIDGDPIITDTLKNVLEALQKYKSLDKDDNVSEEEFENLYNFIKDLFYSEDVHIGINTDKTRIFYESKTPTDIPILDRVVNFNDVNLDFAQMTLPFTGEEFSYSKFIKENFSSSAVPVEIEPGVKQFEKINRRVTFLLRNSTDGELTHKQVLDALKETTSPKKPIIVSVNTMGDKIVGKVFMSKKGNPVEIISYNKRKKSYIVRSQGGTDTEVTTVALQKDLDMSKEVAKVNPSEETVNEFKEKDIASEIDKKIKDEILLSPDNNIDDIDLSC